MGLSEREYMRSRELNNSSREFFRAKVYRLKERLRLFWANSLTNKIICLNVAIFLIYSLFSIEFFHNLFLTSSLIKSGFIYCFLTYGFFHTSFFHLICNILTLYFVGNVVERVSDKKTYLFTYLGGIVAGGLLWSFFNWENNAYLIGASAGICSLFSYFCILNRDLYIQLNLFFVLPIRLKAWLIYLIFFAITIVCLALFEIRPDSNTKNGLYGIAHSAHLGGILMGAFIARIAEFSRKYRFRKNIKI